VTCGETFNSQWGELAPGRPAAKRNHVKHLFIHLSSARAESIMQGIKSNKQESTEKETEVQKKI
jgi:hypothetical protein